ncbi:uncharacterized protein LOC115627027 [Scaptodrosophila lebanonensis]|uniref:Uncharacterized protein LOC115627027 n=1 Tax=Drosophila lebanonensis TaxID=7225 RepID=A0A6J2TTF5_DROLE|nr:uncharacterized protein LOC115627027 [Scaptodrosophila lebanonensis]XP_030378428.1 uncharacterized protein LOC115627027 [Scaptodrosophila lebanonensis]
MPGNAKVQLPRAMFKSVPRMLMTPILIFAAFCCISAQKETSPFFPSQNRFIPSSGQFPSNFGTGTEDRSKASTIRFSNTPGSYHEQIVFSESNNNNKDAAHNTQVAKPYWQPEYYDVSPRPFGVPENYDATKNAPQLNALANVFTRPKAIRNGSTSNGITQASQPNRGNVLQQHTQFSTHSTSPTNVKQLESNIFDNNAPPLPSHIIPHRYQRNYQATAKATRSSVTAESSEINRNNRFGISRTKHTTTTSTSLPIKHNTSFLNRNISSSRRLVFNSSIQSEHSPKQRHFGLNNVRLRPLRPSSSIESIDDTKEHKLGSQEQQKGHLLESEPAAFEEKLIPSKKAEVTKTRGHDSNEEPVILTSNFYLSDGTRMDGASGSIGVLSDFSTDGNEDLPTDSSEIKDSTEIVTDIKNDENISSTEESDPETTEDLMNTLTTDQPGDHRLVEATSLAPSKNNTMEYSIEKEDQDESEYGSGDEEDFDEYEYDEEDGSGEYNIGKETTEDGTIKEKTEREIISVVTTKSIVNGSTAFPASVTPGTWIEDIDSSAMSEKEYMKTSGADITMPAPQDDGQIDHSATSVTQLLVPSTPDVTENYVVVASVQTSRSINGARFLPFPSIEQEETKKTLSELERKVHLKQQHTQFDTSREETRENTEFSTNTSPTETLPTLENETSTSQLAITDLYSTEESIIDKLDRVQSELSSGLLSGKYPVINEMDASATVAPVTPRAEYVLPHIRKFVPKTTTMMPHTTTSGNKLRVPHIKEVAVDDLSSLLPMGFKPKTSYKNWKITTSTSTTTKMPTTVNHPSKPSRNSSISRSFRNGGVVLQDIELIGLLPKGYKLPKIMTTPTPTSTIIISKETDFESIFRKTKFDDSLAALLPKDYNIKITQMPKVENLPKHGDISKGLPPDDNHSKEEEPKAELSSSVLLTKIKDIQKFLPPGYELNKTDDNLSVQPKQKVYSSSLRPPLTVVTTPQTNEAPVKELSNTSGSLKVVFPKGFHKRIGSHRLTTPHTLHDLNEERSSPPVVIKKGPPTRASTEFTGWPTSPTTPLSIEKMSVQVISFEDLLAKSTTTSIPIETSTDTTTTTTTQRPTKPGHCKANCDLAGTIKIIGGVTWKPELLDHNTQEWKNLAHELETQLNEIFSTGAQLRQWYNKVRIDSFSKGSVLVDYYVEFSNITQDVDTLEIKQLFHDALKQPSMHSPPIISELEDETNIAFETLKQNQSLNYSYQMGKYLIDPVATEFSVIAKNVQTNVEYAEEDLFIPQWAIVVIVIGIGSLVFVVIFGVTVLLNRQKRAKKVPIPLTNDMLNELKVNHMSGADNYGIDDFYNIDDPWKDTKSKRFDNSVNGGNNFNIYDSWRSNRSPLNGTDYLYDQQLNLSQKVDSLKRQNLNQHSQYIGHQYPDAFANAQQMYNYNHNTSRARYPRDYDPDF